jgi:hypothetical protein
LGSSTKEEAGRCLATEATAAADRQSAPFSDTRPSTRSGARADACDGEGHGDAGSSEGNPSDVSGLRGMMAENVSGYHVRGRPGPGGFEIWPAISSLHTRRPDYSRTSCRSSRTGSRACMRVSRGWENQSAFGGLLPVAPGATFGRSCPFSAIGWPIPKVGGGWKPAARRSTTAWL